ncbi:MAG: winged helix-turn-helix domain-containing protein [Chloroflexi bacterium]|nr:winged helix-turn-helix domain-containing protein [Chloroflexota bacterium]
MTIESGGPGLVALGRHSLWPAGPVQGQVPRARGAPVAVLDQASPADGAQVLRALRVQCLGSFEVWQGWDKVGSWRSMKAKSVFKYLIAQRGRRVPKDELMETVWPECEPHSASDSLKVAVHSLRQTLSDRSPVMFTEGRYAINPQLDLWVDADEFEHCWKEGRSLEAMGKPSEALTLYERCESLYRGDYLEEDVYEEWTFLRRESLKDTYLTVVSKLARGCMNAGDYEGAIVHCHALLGKDPCAEHVYRDLIRSYTRLGRRTRALSWYNMCVKTLKTALDIEPDRETKELHGRLLAGEAL